MKRRTSLGNSQQLIKDTHRTAFPAVSSWNLWKYLISKWNSARKQLLCITREKAKHQHRLVRLRSLQHLATTYCRVGGLALGSSISAGWRGEQLWKMCATEAVINSITGRSFSLHLLYHWYPWFPLPSHCVCFRSCAQNPESFGFQFSMSESLSHLVSLKHKNYPLVN